jgi:predicted RND superfamily exporter protein
MAVSFMLFVLTLIGVSRLEVENSFVNYFGENTEIYRGLKLIDEKLGGTTGLELILSLEEQDDGRVEALAMEDDLGPDLDDLDAAFGGEEQDQSDYWFTTGKIDTIKKVHDYLETLPAVGKVQSLASTIRVAEDLNSGQPFDAFEMAILYKRLPEALKAVMLSPYVSIEDNEARISLRVKDSLKDLRRKELLDQIHADITGKLGIADDKLEMTGLLVLYNNMLQSLYASQIQALGSLMLGITIMLVVLFRSVTLAIIGIIPNILVSVFILGLLGLLGIPLDMMTITICSITMGIAVEYSIQYIYRFREEYESSPGDYTATMFYCHANIGRAIYYVAITLIVGFSIMVLSNFIPTISFGVFVAMSMFLALVASLTLLPKILMLWKPF